MIVRNMQQVQGTARADGVVMTNFFGYDIPAGKNVKMGHAVFPPGTVVPPAAHEEDEYSFILSGQVKSQSGGKLNVLDAGCCGFIPAGEEHASFNDSDEAATLIWLLIGK